MCNFTLQKYIFPAKFTSKKRVFFSKKYRISMIDFCSLRTLACGTLGPYFYPASVCSDHLCHIISTICVEVSKILRMFVEIYLRYLKLIGNEETSHNPFLVLGLYRGALGGMYRDKQRC